MKEARAALDAGLPFERLVAGPRDLLAPLYETQAFKDWETARSDLELLHGPMLGAVTDSSALFWVRTADAAEVQVRIGNRVSEIEKSGPATDFTATAKIGGLSPETQYEYEVMIDGRAVEAESRRFTTYPKIGEPARFSVAFGGGAAYVPQQERMWDTIRESKPIAMFMLGDNVYIDQPEHLLCQNYCYYRRQARPEWRRLVASTAMYAVYDDHDFGTNDCVPGPEIVLTAVETDRLEQVP